MQPKYTVTREKWRILIQSVESKQEQKCSASQVSFVYVHRTLMHRYFTQTAQPMCKDGCEGQHRETTTAVGTKFEALMTAAYCWQEKQKMFKFW